MRELVLSEALEAVDICSTNLNLETGVDEIKKGDIFIVWVILEQGNLCFGKNSLLLNRFQLFQ